jgi:hypothetical protein
MVIAYLLVPILLALIFVDMRWPLRLAAGVAALVAIGWTVHAAWTRRTLRRRLGDTVFNRLGLAGRGYRRDLMEIDESGQPVLALHPSRGTIMVFPGLESSAPTEIVLASITSLRVEGREMVKDCYTDGKLDIGLENGEAVTLWHPVARPVRVRLEQLRPDLKVAWR